MVCPHIDARRRGVVTLLFVLLLVPIAAFAASAQTFEDEVANLKSPTVRTRQSAVRALGDSRRSEAVAPISALVRDPDAGVRLEVVRALAKLRDVSGVPALVTSLQDGDPKIRSEAINAIVQIYSERDNTGALERFLQTFSDDYKEPTIPPFTVVDPTVFQGLAGTLRDEETQIRAASARAIGILGGGVVSERLVGALQDPETSVRAAAVTALARVGTSEDGRALIPLLADESSDVRNRTIAAIGALEVEEAGPALREMYEQNQRGALGTRVLEAMTKTRDPKQADLYRDLLTSGDLERRRLAVEGLARISDPSTIDGFKKDYQRETDPGVKLAYNFAITLLGDRAFLDSIVLALGASGERAEQARGYILELGPGIAPDLYPYLGDPDPRVRAALADVLAQLGDPAAIEKLNPLVSDPDSEVADAANRAIQSLRRAGASMGQ
jgi:HEAT repeat protein